MGIIRGKLVFGTKTTRRYANWLEGCVDDVLIPGEERVEEVVEQETDIVEVDDVFRLPVDILQSNPKECISWDCFKLNLIKNDKDTNANIKVKKIFEYEGYQYEMEFPLQMSFGKAEVTIKDGQRVPFVSKDKVSVATDDINLYFYKGLFDRSSVVINIEESEQEYIDDVKEDDQVSLGGSKQRKLTDDEIAEFIQMLDIRETQLEYLRSVEGLGSMIVKFNIDDKEFSNQFNCYISTNSSEFRKWRFNISKGNREREFELNPKIDLSIFGTADTEYNGNTLCYPSDDQDEVLNGTFLNLEQSDENIKTLLEGAVNLPIETEEVESDSDFRFF